MPSLSTWLTSPFLPAATLAVGATLTWLTRQEKPALRILPSRWQAMPVIHTALPAVFASGAIAAIWMLRRSVSPFRFLLIFPPMLGADLSLRAQMDAWSRLFGLMLLWPVLPTAWLVATNSLPNCRSQRNAPAWPQWFLLLATAFFALAAADWLTLSAALALFDLVHFSTSAPGTERGWNFAANGLANLALLAAAFALSLDGHSLALSGDSLLPTPAALLIIGAALVRLAPYPLHLWLGDSSDISPLWQWPMRLSSPVLGLYLLTRVAPLLGWAVPGLRLALIVGAGGCLVAALLAWLTAQHEARQAMPLLALYQINLALLEWAVSGRQYMGLWTALNLILGPTALAVYQEWLHARDDELLTWHDAAPSAVAAAALAGLPLTVGMLVRLPLYGALLAGRLAIGLALILVAESMFVVALLRAWGGLRPNAFSQQPRRKQQPWNTWGAMALLVAPLLVLGMHPPLAAWLAGFPATAPSLFFAPLWQQPAEGGIGLWAALFLPLVMGYGVYRSEWSWPAEIARVEGQLVSLLRLGWLHSLSAQLLGQMRQALWSVGTLLHGEGYLAWVALSLLLIFLLVLNR